MPHLDEGLIAELLDGETRPAAGGPMAREVDEHLESCAACQHRLATARANRERAQALLALAGPPGIDVPPFAEIQARAGRTGRRGRSIPYRALGAAAVVAIAAGLGWYVRGTTMDPVRPATPPRTPGMVAAAPEEVRATEPEAARSTTAAEVAAPPAERDAQVALGAGSAGNRARQDDRAAAAAARVTEEREAPPVAAQRLMDSVGRVAALQPMTLARDEPAAEPAREAAIAPDAWRAVPRAEAERLLGGSIALIAGLPVESHRVSSDGGPVQVRTTQILPDGAEVELVQWRRPPAVEAPAPAPSLAQRAQRRDAAADTAGGASLVVEVDGFVVTGRARVPADSLRVLLGRLRR